MGGQIQYVDPYVEQIDLDHSDHAQSPNPDSIMKAVGHDAVKTADCVVIDHTSFDYKKLVEDAALIVDTRNALKGVKSEKVFRL